MADPIKVWVKVVPDAEPNAHGRWEAFYCSGEFGWGRLQNWDSVVGDKFPGHHPVAISKWPPDLTA